MRSWIARSASFAAVVTIVKVAIASPAGPRHSSHSPASASGAPETRRMKYGCLRPPATGCHS
jgi:hypothetical protein